MLSSCSGRVAAALLMLVATTIGAAENGALRSFARAPALAMPKLSPDGKRFSYVEYSQHRQTVVIRALADGTERRMLSLQPARERARWCGWAGSRHLLCGTVLPIRRQDRVAEQTRLYSIDVNGVVRELNTRLEDPVRDQVIDLAPSRAAKVLVQHDAAGRGYPEVAELDVVTGALRRIERPRPPIRRWMSDGLGNVRLGVGYDGSLASLHIPGADGEDWSVRLEQSLADPDAVGPLALGASNDLYVLKHHRGRAALFRLNLQPDLPVAPTLLFAHPLYDVAGPVVLHPQSRELLAVHYVAQYEQVHAFDSAEARTRAWLDEQLPDAVNLITDRSDDGKRLLVHSASDVNPPSLFVLDSDTSALRLLGHQYPELENRTLAPMRSITYRARDGQTIPAYLTLPLNEQARGLPAVILPHGGPETRDWRTFDPMVQFLTAQGYAVLQVNFRGSFGYGAGFAAAGVGQWGGVIHNDITDGTRWLVEQGLADPTRICIAGLSFGGYAALLGAARESQWYACAASFAGVSDLMALAQYTERLPDAETWRQRLGEDSRALWQMSPLARVHAIETPILMMHGRLDPVAPVSQGRRFARALRKAGKQHKLVERADCDHEMTIEPCRLAFFAELQRFLAEALEGEAER